VGWDIWVVNVVVGASMYSVFAVFVFFQKFSFSVWRFWRGYGTGRATLRGTGGWMEFDGSDSGSRACEA
jgi:hypothetical protein